MVKNRKNTDIEYELDLGDSLKKLKDKLKECSKERKEYLDGWQRERADFANFKVEVQKKNEKLSELSKVEIILQLLPVLDSFDMAFSDKRWDSIDSNWRVGVESIYTQILEVLKSSGVREIEAETEFNPEHHHSFDIVSTDKKSEDGKIAEIVQKGYLMAGKVLRPTRVKVYKLK